MNIPEVICGFNVYDDTNKLVGLTGNVQLPNFSPITETIKGAGILGEYDTSVAGMFSSMEIKLQYQMVSKEMLSKNKLTLRAAQQYRNGSTGKESLVGMRIVIQGPPKGTELGSVENGKAMNASQTREITYILIEQDGKTLIELDKLNYKYVVDGVDMLKKVRKLI